MNSLRKLIVTGLGTGYLPVSGTWGSAVPCAAYLALACAMRGKGQDAAPLGLALNLLMAAVAVVSSIACVRLGAFAERTFGKKDPRQCTIDEWAGQAVALLLLPVSAPDRIWQCVLTAFLAFRFFDILKPPPARQMEKLPQGWGVLLDDLVAGVYANLVSQLILRLGLHLC
ncbi:MAG: phosphatidylglycerophosphatase A [Phycisphaerae bacterium]|jgi:phosphatidylglycerophosphatase A